MELTRRYVGAFELPSRISSIIELESLPDWRKQSARLRICLKTAGIIHLRELLLYQDYDIGWSQLGPRIAKVPGMRAEQVEELLAYLEQQGITGALRQQN